MGLGGTAKKLQQVINMAEELYARMNDLREQLQQLRETVEETNATVQQLQQENAELRAVVGAMAEQQGIDPQEVVASQQRSEGAVGGHTDRTGTQSNTNRGSAPGSSSIDQPPDR